MNHTDTVLVLGKGSSQKTFLRAFYILQQALLDFLASTVLSLTIPCLFTHDKTRLTKLAPWTQGKTGKAHNLISFP